MGNKNINFGKKRPPEVLEKISKTKALRPYHHTEEDKKRQSDFMKNKKFALGYKHTEESRAKMREYQRNRPPISDVTRRKISESKKQYWANKLKTQTYKFPPEP